VALALLASPAWAAGLLQTSGLPAALAAVGQIPGFGGSGSRQESDQLLKQARAAMAEGRMDQAEQLLAKAEKIAFKYDPVAAKIGDTPAKLRRDLEAAKAKGSTPPGGNSRLPSLLPSGRDNDPRAQQAASDRSINTLTDASGAKARQWLELGRKALAQGNTVEAQAAYQKAAAIKTQYGANEYTPESLAADLKKAGVNVSQLPTSGGNPSPFTLRPSDIPADGDSYLAPAKPGSPANYSNAFGGGDYNPNNLPPDRNPLTAPKNADDYQTDYAPAAPSGRDPQAALPQRLPGTAPTMQRLPRVDDQVRPAGGGFNANDPKYPVSPGVYDPQRDNTRVRQVQGEGLNAPPAVNGSRAEKLYRDGLDALENGDREAAMLQFQEAWRFEGQLDPQTRQDLKDKLSLLRQASLPPSNPAPVAEEVDSEQYLRYQKFLGEIAAEKQAAQKLANEEPRKALSNLKDLRQRVADADLDPQGRRLLLTNLDRSTKELEDFIERHRGDIELREKNNEVRAMLANERKFKSESQQKIADLVDKFNRLMEEQRYAEAEVIAKQVRELDPESSIAEMLAWKSQFAKNLASSMSIQDEKSRNFTQVMLNVDDSSKPFNDNQPFQFGPVTDWNSITKSRRQRERENGRKLNPAEQEIEKSLGKQVELNFKNRPLAEVIEVLGKMAGINIVLDPQGLHAEAVDASTPVTFELNNPIMLKSALDLILGQLQLSYVIEHEVLLITSKDMRDSHTYVTTYYVADLVTPIPNFVPNYNIGLPGAIRESFAALGAYGGMRGGLGSGIIPVTLAQNDANGQANQNNSVLAQMGGAQMQGQNGSSIPIPLPNPGTRPQTGAGNGPGGLGGGVIADFDTLIDLITSTISPDSWTDNGGQGSINGFPTNLSLVVSQTQDIHADIADLLQQLRRLQDLQVTIEVRFITLRDNFFERVGIDFDFQVDDNTGFTSNSVLPDDTGRSKAFGLAPNGQPTSDFDFRFAQDTFASAVPQFGGFDASSAANFGFAILSDIEVFFLLQALQGDQRSNVLQAPKVTLFNGQQAFVTDTVQRPFVTQIIPVVGDFAAAQQPVVTVLNEGTSLSVQAVVSSDRRFVRLTLVPMFSRIGDVETFTFNGKTTSNTGTTVQDPTDPTKKVTNNESTTTEGTTVQLPSLAVTTVSTTVSVPDGGTVLLGGIKRLREGRNERGVPLLSKLPYISRLFKNVGIGRETESLMMMVTPRIIIQEEEEDKLGLGLENG
jgi:general secretion pathway protein D